MIYGHRQPHAGLSLATALSGGVFGGAAGGATGGAFGLLIGIEGSFGVLVGAFVGGVLGVLMGINTEIGIVGGTLGVVFGGLLGGVLGVGGTQAHAGVFAGILVGVPAGIFPAWFGSGVFDFLSHAFSRPRPLATTSTRGSGTQLSMHRFRRNCRETRQLTEAHRTTVRLVDHLLTRAVHQLPDSHQDRWAEEWSDHRNHLRGLRLLWWALCIHLTAARIARELRPAQFPHTDR